jgi:hypothetical protein
LDYLNHPKFRSIRAEVVLALKRGEYRFRRLGPVLFLCGGADSDRRITLLEYLEQNHPEFNVFFAEGVWDVITRNAPAVNALEMEQQLASLADAVIVIVESPGTFTELGAFGSSPDLRKKLLPILDATHQHSRSFINTGPVRWIDEDSLFKPSLWITLDPILGGASQIEERLARIPPTTKEAIPNLAESPKHLVFFACDIVSVFGPCSPGQVQSLLGDLLGQEPIVEAALLLALSMEMELLRSIASGTTELFYRPLTGGKLPSFHYMHKYINIPTLRLRVISGMQRFPEGIALLEMIRNASAA